MRTREMSLGPSPGSSIVVGTNCVNTNMWRSGWPPSWYCYTPVTRQVADPRTAESKKRTTDELHPGPPYLTGGPLDIYSISQADQWIPQSEGEYVTIYSSTGNPYQRYTGGFLPRLLPTAYLDYSRFDLFAGSSWGDASSYGAAAWNRFRPTRSSTDLGVALGELSEIPRMLKTTASLFYKKWRAMGGSASGFGPRSVANHWLNTQFGWLPFISDLRDLYKTTLQIDSRLKKLRQENGKWKKRSGNMVSDNETDVVLSDTTMTGLYPTLATGFYPNYPITGSTKITRTNTREIWFEGAFRFWIPGKPDSLAWKSHAVAQLYGLYPSPALIWELIPFSWLVDYFADVGDIAHNISSMMFDNLCAKYAYLMGTTRQSVDYSGTADILGGPAQGSWNCYIERKTRVAASPFGFGLLHGDLTARQLSILAAFGITRLPR